MATKQLVLTAEQMNAFLPYLEGVLSGDDKGIKIVNGQLSVGEPGDGYESVFGEGDSYPVPVAFHCDVATTSGLTITGATDVSSIFQSDDLSTSGLFGGDTTGKYILVGSPYRYGGTKMKINTPGTIEPDNVIAEYLQDNTPTWVEAKYMAVSSEFPYTQLGNVLAGSSGSEQWRFGYDPLSGIPTWDEVTLNINGSNYTYRWARFRITSAITLDPVIEQIKLHTNRFEANADGTTEYHGRARYARDLQMHWTNTIQLNGLSPANEDITFADGIVLDYQDNEFVASATDGRGGYIIVPEGLDTSIPITFEILWTPLNNNAGDIYFEFLFAQRSVGDVLDDTLTPVTLSGIETVAANSDNLLRRTRVQFLVNELTPGDILAFGFKRVGGDAQDTYSGGAAVINVRTVGYFWRP